MCNYNVILVIFIMFYFLNNYVFFMLSSLIFLMMNSLSTMSWGGVFLLNENMMNNIMVYMSMIIMFLIFMSEKNYMIIMLSQILIIFSVLFFYSKNLINLYIFFELSMVPIMLMILGYGMQIEKINSSYYLIIYASFCSFPFLYVYFNYLMNIELVYFNMVLNWELVFLLTLTFMMKFPVYFLHLWLPKAHVEASTTASMLLAGLLLKLGTMGFLRILKLLIFTHLIYYFILSFLSMILSSFICSFQSDSKSLAAYSSISHMGFTLMCLLILSMISKTSAYLMMLSHGFCSTLMFFMIGEFYHQSNNRLIYYMNSYFNVSIMLTMMFMLVILSNAGVPPSISFFSEFMGVTLLMNLMFFNFLVMFVYFFFAFYYSIYFLINFMMGKKSIYLISEFTNSLLYFLFLMFNFMIFSLLF